MCPTQVGNVADWRPRRLRPRVSLCQLFAPSSCTQPSPQYSVSQVSVLPLIPSGQNASECPTICRAQIDVCDWHIYLLIPPIFFLLLVHVFLILFFKQQQLEYYSKQYWKNSYTLQFRGILTPLLLHGQLLVEDSWPHMWGQKSVHTFLSFWSSIERITRQSWYRSLNRKQVTKHLGIWILSMAI